MQSPPSLIRCSRSSVIVAFRMLTPCSSPNPSPNPGPRLSCSIKTTSDNPQTSSFPVLNTNLKLSNSDSPNLHGTTTISKSFSIASNPRASPVPISSTSGVINQQSDMDDSTQHSLIVVSFYKFADFPDHADIRRPLKELCEKVRVSGGIILAPEGINGSICGTKESVEVVLGFIQADNRLKGLRQIESPVSPEEEAIHHGHTSNSPLGAGEDAPFRWDHVRVKLKKEIVSLGLPTISPIERVGKYVEPRDWNALVKDPNTVVIDVRNAYETRIGKFQGAVDPNTMAFREFPSWVDDILLEPGSGHGRETEVEDNNSNGKEPPNIQGCKPPLRVAMYCTGGIRCEKASSFLMSKGIEEVYHLKGGILKYLEEVPKTESLWEGECFVFDKRVSVEHGLVQGNFKLCYGCKQPVSDEDMESPHWESGVTCPYCYHTKSEEEKERARARQRQFESWGVIGGPDKGRSPLTKSSGVAKPSVASSQTSKSL